MINKYLFFRDVCMCVCLACKELIYKVNNFRKKEKRKFKKIDKDINY